MVLSVRSHTVSSVHCKLLNSFANSVVQLVSYLNAMPAFHNDRWAAFLQASVKHYEVAYACICCCRRKWPEGPMRILHG